MTVIQDRGTVELHGGWLRVRFPNERHADFHFRWLRHNCDQDRHPVTGERTVDSSELPDELGVESARIEADALLVRWTHDGRESRYALAWLLEHAYALDRSAPISAPSDAGALEIRRAERTLEAAVDQAIDLLRSRGAAIVRADRGSRASPADETETIIQAFAARDLEVIGTHFGRIEDLRTDNTTNQNTDQLGYTDAAVGLHTDQPFIVRPPPVQVLQSIRSADRGGENYLVDAFAAAKLLRATDRRAHELLSTVPVTFHRKQKAFESLVRAPILGEGPRGPLVRYSYFTMAPYQLPFEDMEEWYRAYDRYARIVRSADNQYRFALSPGDFLVYDNHRMLHARTAFSGPRWVRGIYFAPRGSPA
jgi:alpha-ketoglutarate-dependent taurine dioxygenase